MSSSPLSHAILSGGSLWILRVWSMAPNVNWQTLLLDAWIVQSKAVDRCWDKAGEAVGYMSWAVGETKSWIGVQKNPSKPCWSEDSYPIQIYKERAASTQVFDRRQHCAYVYVDSHLFVKICPCMHECMCVHACMYQHMYVYTQTQWLLSSSCGDECTQHCPRKLLLILDFSFTLV